MLLIFELKTLLRFFRHFTSGEINFVEAIHFLLILPNNVAILKLNAHLDIFLRQLK